MVIGELNKPEIFTDRDGKPQISMSLTAYNLWFSPFGRTDGGHSDHSQAATSEIPAETVAHGQGKVPAFTDDEVPF